MSLRAAGEGAGIERNAYALTRAGGATSPEGRGKTKLPRERYSQRICCLTLAFFALVQSVGEADEAVGDAFIAGAGGFDAGGDQTLGESLAFIAQWIVTGSED